MNRLKQLEDESAKLPKLEACVSFNREIPQYMIYAHSTNNEVTASTPTRPVDGNPTAHGLGLTHPRARDVLLDAWDGRTAEGI